MTQRRANLLLVTSDKPTQERRQVRITELERERDLAKGALRRDLQITINNLNHIAQIEKERGLS